MKYPNDFLMSFVRGKQLQKAVLGELVQDGYIAVDPHDETHRLTVKGDRVLNGK